MFSWLRLIIYRRQSGFILNDRKYQDSFSRIRVIKIQKSVRFVFIHSTILFQLIDISCKEIYLDLRFSFVIVSLYFQYRDRVSSMSKESDKVSFFQNKNILTFNILNTHLRTENNFSPARKIWK